MPERPDPFEALRRPLVPEVFGFDPRVQFVHEDDVVSALMYATTNEIQDAACSQGMKTLRQNALQKVIDGVTTVEEVLRVTLGT